MSLLFNSLILVFLKFFIFFSKFQIEREKCVVIVTSTTGDGEPPDTALKFFRRIKKKTLPSDYLSDLNYALLGMLVWKMIHVYIN